MVMMMNEFEEMISVIEKFRKKDFPNIPADLIRDIIISESNYLDNPTDAIQQTRHYLDEYLKGV
jgi:hypothetical protein